MSSILARPWERLARTSDIGVAAILILEIVILSLATIKTMPLRGAAAGRAIAVEVAHGTGEQGVYALFHTESSSEQAEFVAALRQALQTRAPEVREIDLGSPPFSAAAVGRALEPHLDAVAVVIAPHAVAAGNVARAMEEAGRDIPVLAPGERRVSVFLQRENLLDVARAFSFIAIAAIGACLVIITAGIDLSVGSVIGLSGMVTAYALKEQGEPVWAAIMCGLAAGALAGMLNGLLIARWQHSRTSLLVPALFVGACAAVPCLRWSGWSLPARLGVVALVMLAVPTAQRYFLARVALPPFIATLGMLSIGRGLTFWISGGQQITTFGGFSENIGRAAWPLIPLPGLASLTTVPAPVVVMLWLTLLFALFLTRTVWGRRIHAIGGNETAARLAGIDVDGVKVLVYTLAGLLAAVAGVLYVSRFDYASSGVGRGYELQVIAACVIGGASLSGGRGTIVGAVLGAAIMGVLHNGLTLLGVLPELVDMVIGSIIILAVTIDQLKKRNMLL